MTDSKNPINSKQLRLEFKFPDDLQTRFATTVIIQPQPDYFTISFFEVLYPLIIGQSPEEIKKVVDSLSKAEARCVAKITLTPQLMREFAKLIETNLNNYDLAFKSPSKE
jgi:hypothetical protein